MRIVSAAILSFFIYSSTTLANPIADPYRLGQDVVPTFEAIKLTVDAQKDAYSGEARITLKVKKQTDVFRFHAKEMALANVTLKGASGDIKLSHEASDAKIGLIQVKTAAPLQPGEYTLFVGFSKPYNRKAMGLYKCEVDSLGYTFTDFECYDARLAFPCWDEPGFKIPFQISAIVPEAYMALSNTPIEAETVQNNQRTYVFEKTPPMSTYLLALMTGPFDTVPIPDMPIPTRVVTTKGQTHLAAEAIQMTPSILKAVVDYFGSPYPYKKLDFIAVPEFQAGAMENPGAITFLEDRILLDPTLSTFDDKVWLAETITHELAHMWFGNLVTLAWWDDLWLNESFASWVEGKITAQVFPEFGLPARFVSEAHEAMFADALPSSRAIRVEMRADQDPFQMVGDLAYPKGQAVLAMIEQWLGEDVFRTGVRAYMKEHAWKNATAADLWAALSKAAGKDVGTTMAAFVNQAGVPLVKAELLADNKVKLTQQRFVNFGQTIEPALWQVPVILHYGDGDTILTEKILLSRAEETVQLPSKKKVVWLHPNADEKGYYRWSVPSAAMNHLAQYAPKILGQNEQVGYVSNLASLFMAGQLGGDAYLSLLEDYAANPDPKVLGEIIVMVKNVHFMLVGQEELMPVIAAYVKRVFRPALERIGLQPPSKEDGAISSLRADLITFLGGGIGRDLQVKAYAESLAHLYLQDPNKVHPSLVKAGLSVAAQYGDTTLVRRCIARFEGANSAAERDLFLDILGQFRQSDAVKMALAYVETGPLHAIELGAIPRGMSASGQLPRDFILDWVIDKFEFLKGRIPPAFVRYMVWFSVGCSQEKFDKGRVFFSDPVRATPEILLELESVKSAVESCIPLKDKEGDHIIAYLKRTQDQK